MHFRPFADSHEWEAPPCFINYLTTGTTYGVVPQALGENVIAEAIDDAEENDGNEQIQAMVESTFVFW